MTSRTSASPFWSSAAPTTNSSPPHPPTSTATGVGNSEIASSTTTLWKGPVVRKRNNVRTLRRRDGLLQYARNVTSQNGEDGILHHLFGLLFQDDAHGLSQSQQEETNATTSSTEQQPSNRSQHVLVDVGAWDGKHWSNTYSLLHHKGQHWSGILIEANPDRCRELQQLYEHRHPNHSTSNPHNPVVCLQKCVSSIPHHPNSLVALLDQYGPDVGLLPDSFDFLCIDVDGPDYWIFWDLLTNGLWHPKVVCIEFNPTMPNDLIYIPPTIAAHNVDDPNETRDAIIPRHGASLAALVELATQHNYILVETTLYNAFLVQLPLYDQYLSTLIPDTSIETLHEVTMGTSMYQLYDGTLKVHGCKKLLWHRIPIDETQLQVLPESQRQFPFAPTNPSSSSSEQPKFDDLQVIDMSSWCSVSLNGHDDPITTREDCAKQLLDQLLRQGFCHVRGTGVLSELCRSALQQSQWFFQEADDTIRRECLSQDRARRGYSPMCTENFAALIGDKAPNDLVQKFRVGPPSIESSTANGILSSSPSSSSLLQPNVWPNESWGGATSFRSTVEAYFESANRAANCIVQAICHALLMQHPDLVESLRPLTHAGVEPDETRNGEMTSSTSSILTLLGYSVGSRHKGKSKGPLVAAHTDVGVLTFLLFDDGNCATLQRHKLETEVSRSSTSSSLSSTKWVDVSLPVAVPDDPIFVVNVADCLSELSGGKLPSTLHRVVANRPPSGNTKALRPRTCCALFVGLQPDAQLQLQGETMTYEEWRKRRIDKAIRVMKS